MRTMSAGMMNKLAMNMATEAPLSDHRSAWLSVIHCHIERFSTVGLGAFPRIAAAKHFNGGALRAGSAAALTVGVRRRTRQLGKEERPREGGAELLVAADDFGDFIPDHQDV